MLAGLSSSSDDDVADLANTTNLNDALAMKKHKLEELMLAYRLTGNYHGIQCTHLRMQKFILRQNWILIVLCGKTSCTELILFIKF